MLRLNYSFELFLVLFDIRKYILEYRRFIAENEASTESLLMSILIITVIDFSLITPYKEDLQGDLQGIY